MEFGTSQPAGHNAPDKMKTLTEVMAKMVREGYTENMSIKEGKLYVPSSEKLMEPEEVQITNFYRFEGASNPEDMDILYVIETNTGEKGLLADGYGTYSTEGVTQFIKRVEDIQKLNKK